MSTNPAAALAFAILIASGFAGGASAAPAAAPGVTKVAEATSPARPAAAGDGEDDAGTCSRLRRRLWVEGEGWIVRRVTTCR